MAKSEPGGVFETLREDVEDASEFIAAAHSTSDVANLSSSKEEDAAPPFEEGVVGHPFENAFRALDLLRLQENCASSPDDSRHPGNKINLVEKFVTSLAESLSNLPPLPPPTSSPTSGNRQSYKSHQPVVERLVESIVGDLISENVKQPVRQMPTAYSPFSPSRNNLPRNHRSAYHSQQRRHQLIDQMCHRCDKVDSKLGGMK